ncbi:hypothetical protein A5742_25650 [Mycolicibacterium fortuitum]|uniref:Transposase n=1 Tax=Mycolicibacterium fortuitum TaxID=1766 RepID=A0ABD6QMX4_MYCFO|nr:hypothetical protein [Mycolicibacterium fortuitum]OMC46164.1 hypothetical protein A5742_25650 [Mycolicibacterium fortuitum]
MAEDFPDHKSVKVFKHVKDGPEVAPHKSRWDRKKCKRNKGGQHDMELVKDELRTLREYRTFRTPGFRVWEHRPFEVRVQEWRCTHCRKKDQTYPWGVPRVYVGGWEECRREEDKGQP